MVSTSPGKLFNLPKFFIARMETDTFLGYVSSKCLVMSLMHNCVYLGLNVPKSYVYFSLIYRLVGMIRVQPFSRLKVITLAE